MNDRTVKLFSRPLFVQDARSVRAVTAGLLFIMIMMCVVVTFATAAMKEEKASEEVQDTQEDFFAYLGAIAVYNNMTGSDLSYDDFVNADDKSFYEDVFELVGPQMDKELSVDGFEKTIAIMNTSPVGIDVYIQEFEYAFAMLQSQGAFSGEDLELDDMMENTLKLMGVSSDVVDGMSEMDSTAMLSRMYFTVIGLLPVFILIVIYSSMLLASQVDEGSMAYILSTPTRRSAVVFTQALFMVIAPAVLLSLICCIRIFAGNRFGLDISVRTHVILYVGMYLLTEAVAAVNFLGSCLFNQRRKALAFGGGLTVWFFLASLLGMFGTKDMVNLGIGVKQLDLFNHLTLIGLFDVESILDLENGASVSSFAYKLAVLAVIALVCYVAGSIRFTKKDLPL